MKPEWKTCLRVGVSAFALFLCIHYWEPFTSLLALLARAAGPLIVGACIAYVVNIPMSFYERHYFPGSQKPAAVKSRRGVCLLAAYLTFAAIVALLLWIVLPELANCLRMLLSEVPGALNTAATWLMGTELFSDSQWLEDLLADINWRDTIARAAQVLINGIGGTVNLAANVLTRVFSSVVNLVLGLIFATYLLIDRDRLRSQLERWRGSTCASAGRRRYATCSSCSTAASTATSSASARRPSSWARSAPLAWRCSASHTR